MGNLGGLIEKLKAEFKDDISFNESKDGRIIVLIKLDRLLELILCLKTIFEFNQLVSIAGVDYPRENLIACVYHLASTFNKEIIEIKALIKRDEGTMPSIVGIFKNAEWFEKEIHEMLGLRFEGNPCMGRLLLPEGWSEGYPLRKDFKLPEGA